MNKIGLIIESLRRIDEGKDAPLYHWTDYHSAIGILNSNTLGKEGYISFTRDMRYKVRGTANDTCLVIDQSKLSNKYKIEPYVDRFAKGTRKDDAAYREEAEERVKGTIKNIDDYIMEIWITRKAFDELRATCDKFRNDIDNLEPDIQKVYDSLDKVIKALKAGEESVTREDTGVVIKNKHNEKQLEKLNALKDSAENSLMDIKGSKAYKALTDMYNTYTKLLSHPKLVIKG